MTSYKLCATVLVLAGVTVTVNGLYDPSNHRRTRRADAEEERSSGSGAPVTSSDNGYQAGYRFGDEYFLPEASKSIPTEYSSKTTGCDRVTKDSMVCMVCKDPKTNEKYEQCSYVAQPNEKAFTYAKSRSFGNPEKKQSTDEKEDTGSPESSGEAYEASEPSRKSYEKYEASEPTESSYNYEDDSRSPSRYTDSSNEESDSYRVPAESQENKEEYNASSDEKNSDSSEDPAASSDCRQVQKDGQTCSICKDPKTGSDLERCSSSYRPDDKHYSYGKSEKYGYPHSHESYGSPNDDEKSSEARGSYESSPSEFQAGYLKANDDNYNKYRDDEPEEIGESNYRNAKAPIYEGSSSQYTAPSVAAETKLSSDTGGETDCREVHNDGMTCTVCTDPKTGGNFQKCSYAYKPNDKVYKFSKSKTFGYPEGKGSDDDAKSTKGSSDYVRESETKQVPEAVKANPCKQVQRESKTCTVCEDPVTGESSEQCAYSYKPKKKHFAYSNSKSFGTPRNEEKGRDGNSKDEGEQESRQVPRWSDEGDSARSAKQNDDTAEASPCKQVLKGSMTCTVCKDRKTGENSEQCAYSSEPKEKLFTYSKSKSSAGPQKKGKKVDDTSGESKQQESRRRQSTLEPEQAVASEQVETNPCRQVIKDSMTCTICKDPKTGENSEQCAYSSKPKGRHFTYSKSKSFGNPRKEGEEPQESRQNYRKLNEQRDFMEANRPRGFSKPDWDFGTS